MFLPKAVLISTMLIVFSCVESHSKLPTAYWIDEQLEQMTPRDMIAQLFMVTATSSSHEHPGYSKKPWKGDPDYVTELIVKHKVGGLIIMGSFGLMEEHRKKINYYQQLSNIPLLVGIDGEWLPSRINDVPRMPAAMTMGAVQNDDLIYQMGKERAEYCKALGAHIDFAPVVDVNTNPDNPIIGMRAFGDDPEIVARKSILFMKGLQDAGVIACAKHFPGHGDTHYDSHIQLPTIKHSQERLERVELYPFKQVINNGVKAIMPGHLEVPALETEPGLPATFSRSIVTNLLRDQLGFQGLVITDALPMGALKDFAPGQAELKALLAGNDILLCSCDAPLAIDYIEHALEKGDITLEAIKEKVVRVLQAKQWMQEQRHSLFVTQQDLSRIHAPQSYALKQQIFDNAITHVAKVSSYEPIRTSSTTYLLHIGASHEKDFIHALEQDTCIKYTHSSWWVSQVEIEKMREQFKQADSIVVALYDPFCKRPKSDEDAPWYQRLLYKVAVLMHMNQNTDHSAESPCVEITALLEKLITDGKRLTLVVFGSPYSVSKLEKYGEIILAYEDDPCAQQAAAEVICGKRKAIGTLPIMYERRS